MVHQIEQPPRSASLLLSVRQAAEILAVHPRTVYRLRDEGVLDAVPIGRHAIRITRASVERFVGGVVEKEPNR